MLELTRETDIRKGELKVERIIARKNVTNKALFEGLVNTYRLRCQRKGRNWLHETEVVLDHPQGGEIALGLFADHDIYDGIWIDVNRDQTLVESTREYYDIQPVLDAKGRQRFLVTWKSKQAFSTLTGTEFPVSPDEYGTGQFDLLEELYVAFTPTERKHLLTTVYGAYKNTSL